jgi:hypothetical protein
MGALDEVTWLATGTCQWPLWGVERVRRAEYRFCGAPIMPVGPHSYCQAQRELAYQPGCGAAS